LSQSQKQTLEAKLKDADAESEGSLTVRIEVSGSAISVYAEGFGDCGSADGHGCPLFIEYYRGGLRVIAFPNINSEDPKILDLSGAREDWRREGLHEETRLQMGRRYHEFLTQTNPVTGKPFTMSEAASALDVEYGTFRNLEALWRVPEVGEGNTP